VYLPATVRRGIGEVRLTRNGTVYARGHTRRGTTAVRLANRRTMRAGRYTLVLMRTHSARHTVARRSTVRIG
jgi:hypothetical protein